MNDDFDLSLYQATIREFKNPFKELEEGLNKRFSVHEQIILDSLAMNFLLFELIASKASSDDIAAYRKILLHAKNNQDLPNGFHGGADRLLSWIAARSKTEENSAGGDH